MKPDDDSGSFVIPPEFDEQLRDLAAMLTPDEWEKMVNGDPSAARQLGVFHAQCRPMTAEDWIAYRGMAR